ncbi:hypothetical protein NFI96_008150 [Prochilodus magdalenae]|nr:hypothetical protein NFI96_008150 [Prochilodus magdalenae]
MGEGRSKGQNKSSKKKLSPTECSVIAYMRLQSNNVREELDLKKFTTSEKGYRRLIPAITNCRKAKLSGCMVTEKGCSSLASALRLKPSHLNELDLTYNHPGESGVKLLSARLKDPHCSLNTIRVEHGGEIRIKPGPQKYSCEFTLDPNTPNSYLSLSDGNRKVERVEECQSYPDYPERFDLYPHVLSRESLTVRCYWEAEWSGKVYIAVTYKAISRKGDSTECRFGRNKKSWRLECSDNGYSVCYNDISTDISVPPSGCKRVGVYVDCPAGTVFLQSLL